MCGKSVSSGCPATIAGFHWYFGMAWARGAGAAARQGKAGFLAQDQCLFPLRRAPAIFDESADHEKHREGQHFSFERETIMERQVHFQSSDRKWTHLLRMSRVYKKAHSEQNIRKRRVHFQSLDWEWTCISMIGSRSKEKRQPSSILPGPLAWSSD